MQPPDPRTTKRLLTALIIGLGALLTACQQTPPATTITIRLDPSQAELTPGQSHEFTATTTGTSNTSVTWTTTCGTITGNANTITYTAPDSEGTCELTATSDADATKTATAPITITAQDPDPDPDDVTITIEPPTAQLAQGQTQDFTATTTGTDDTTVAWEATCGDIHGDGATITYTAPTTPGTCELTATSAADPSKTATATITIDTIGISIDPNSLEAFLGQGRLITATVAGTTNTNVDWSLTPTCGTIAGTNTTITYTAPTTLPTTRCTLTATSQADPTKQAALTLHLYAPPRATLTATPNTIRLGQELILTWTLTNPTKTLPLTCELHTDGNTTTPPDHTTHDCGRRGTPSSHPYTYPNTGTHTPTLTIHQDDASLATASTDVRVTIEFIQISAGHDFSLGLDRQGNVWAWGGNAYGQLGTGTSGEDSPSDRPVPVCAAGTGPTCEPFNIGPTGSIRAAYNHALAVDASGHAWAWGSNFYGQLGDGTSGSENHRNHPVPVCATGSGGNCERFHLGTPHSVAGHEFHSLAVDAAGRVWSWGMNTYAALGDGTTTSRSNPGRVCATGNGDSCEPLDIGAEGKVQAGNDFSLAVDDAGRVWTWGMNERGQLGDGTLAARLNPGPVCASGSGPDCARLEIGGGRDVAAGFWHALAVDDHGNVWAWGWNGFGQLGNGTSDEEPFGGEPNPNPAPVCASGSGAACEQLNIGATGRVRAGDIHSLAVDDRGRVWAWGNNGSGNLGDGTETRRSNPVAVCAVGGGPGCEHLTIGTPSDIHAGGGHSLALDDDRRAWAWGWNAYGQLGDGTTTSRSNPVPVILP